MGTAEEENVFCEPLIGSKFEVEVCRVVKPGSVLVRGKPTDSEIDMGPGLVEIKVVNPAERLSLVVVMVTIIMDAGVFEGAFCETAAAVDIFKADCIAA